MKKLLDLPLLYTGKSEIGTSTALHQQLQFLWRSAHESVGSSLSLAASKQFQSLVDKHNIDLPEYIRLKLCPWCCAIQIPSITQQTRVRSRGRGSGVNRNLRSVCKIGVGSDRQSIVKVKNGVINRCMICLNKTPSSKVKPKPVGGGGSKDRRDTGLEEAKGARNVQSYLGCKRAEKKKKVPEDTDVTEAALRRKKAKVPHSSSTSPGVGTGIARCGTAGSDRFSFMNTLTTPTPSVRALPFSGLGKAVAAVNVPHANSVSLLDLEEQRKKKKKKKKK